MKKVFARILIVLGVIIVALLLFANYGVYSEGTRAGMVIKVSKKGVLFKTWEGQLNLQSFGAVDKNNSLAEIFSFSIEKGNEEIYQTLQEVSLSGERVNLHYKQKYAILPWKGDSKFFIVKIDRVKDAEPTVPRNEPFRENR